jgi:hypothetical protein
MSYVSCMKERSEHIFGSTATHTSITFTSIAITGPNRPSAGQTLVAQQMVAMTLGSLPAEIDLFPLAFVKKGEGQACPRSGQMGLCGVAIIGHPQACKAE